MPEKTRDVAENRPLDDNARRAREIIASLRTGEPSSTDMFDAFWQLDELPVDDVREALAAWTGPLPGQPGRPLRLRTLSVVKDADILDLGAVAEEQLRLAGNSWDGADLAPEERLDGELEGSFAGTLERRVLADADAARDTPLFDVLLFAEDSGVVFAAGSANVVALIAYGKVEMRDRRTRAAIEEAIAAPSVASSETEPPLGLVAAARQSTDETRVAGPVEEPSIAREEVAKKTTRKAVTKKTTRKAVTKKAVAKKAFGTKAKKAVAKKAVAKKAVGTKAKKAAVASKRTVAGKTEKRATAKTATRSGGRSPRK